ncbi:hypothetical protein ASG29_03615 [Sphingomonas sp. Leaf412]|uniref:EAL domain-containing protein n=1 Tax=Sphingomonas sp. Leaf412 TaxID=1736370 RepID=UPI0006F564F3|nr:EAL domain-containing protein [Sphingomonas sp. Leaf412]KQT35211.1 hypothetical protein ASG29_03615 [Sphingomonas sp. Leaf412]
MRVRSSRIIVAAVAALGLAAMTGTVGGPVERAIEPLRFAMTGKQAGGRTVVVEMDADSTASIGRWPWPRRHYAALVDRLRAAGAATIVFDVDLSARSDPADDAIFAAALARSGGRVTLPTFGQQASASDRRHLDALPLPAFRDHVSLASVSIAPDVDGLVRDMPLATMTAGVPRPSLSAFIAARRGTVDASFPIDLGIDPASIPRLGFVAARDGRFDPAAVRGRDVLVGATAIEMGDRYAVAYRGVLPGVVVQALAAETLIAGVPSRGTAVVPFLLALLAAIPVLRARRVRVAAARLAVAIAALPAAVVAAQHWLLIHFPLALGIVMLLGLGTLVAARDVARRFRDGRLCDEASGLPNHRAFAARDVGTDASAVVAVIQITNLEALSAVLGAEGLAQAIVRTADRLRLASADGRVYRVRSHHLAMMLPTSQPTDDTLAALRAVLLEPVEVAGRKVDVAIVVGVADAGDLAGAALAAEQAARDGTFSHHDSTNRERLERSVSLMGELDEALAAGAIEVHYQPKLCLATNRITSAEALVRWRHPTRGFIPPDTFIPLAEQADRIAPLTLHVLSTVLRDVARWRCDGHAMTAAVNISARLLSSASFNDAVDDLLARSPVPDDALVFEVTESATMLDPAAAIAALHDYRARGIAVSMDDYGTGQCTLSYLRQLPLSELKIDRSFVQHAHEREEDAVLVRSTIQLAHSLSLKVVAEGVEDAANLEFLRASGCDYAQGYFIRRPVPVAEFLAFAAGTASRRAA